MNITRDVLKDLITVYLAGEASADTRTLVEEHLKADPALARDVEEAQVASLQLPRTPPPTAERRALEATRDLLRHRTSSLVVAAIFTALPLTFVFHGTGWDDLSITFFLIRDAPAVGLTWWATAAALWIWHFRIRRRLRVSGL